MRNLVLHIGTPKTGSSAIQRFLSTNRHLLEANGFYYPCEGSYYYADESSQSLLAHALLGRRPKYLKRGTEFTKENCVSDIRRDLQNSGFENAIVSSEHFSHAKTKDEMELIRDAFAPVVSSTKVVIYIRRQDFHIESVYNQCIKTALAVESFDEFSKKSGGINHFKYLDMLSEVFGKPNIIVRPFERNQLFHEDIVSDFVNLLGIEIDFAIPKSTNESISVEKCEIMRLFNRNFDTYEKRKAFNVFLRSTPIKFDEAKYSLLSNEMRKAVLEKHRESNSAVAKSYLGREDGVLFYDSETSSTPFYPGLTLERMAEVSATIWSMQTAISLQLMKKLQSKTE
jgi:hypothetical protein